MRSELPPNTKILAPNDPIIYLLTGRESMRMTIAPKFFYAGGHERMLHEYDNLPKVAREHGMTHLYVNPLNHWELLSEEKRAKLFNSFRTNPNLQERFRCGAATVYEIH